MNTTVCRPSELVCSPASVLKSKPHLFCCLDHFTCSNYKCSHKSITVMYTYYCSPINHFYSWNPAGYILLNSCTYALQLGH